MSEGILRACLAASCLALISADWNSHGFLQNTLDDQPEAEEGLEGEEPQPVAEAWVPGDFAEEISRLRIPERQHLPSRIPGLEDEERGDEGEREGEEEREEEETEEEESEEEEREEEDSEDSGDRDYASFEGTQGNQRPYVVNYEVTETIPFDTKKPRPKGPVYPLPPPCPGAPPPTFPPPPPNPSKPPPPTKKPPPPPKDWSFFPSPYESYFPTSYMSQSHTAPQGTLVLPWTRLPAAFYTHLPGPAKVQQPTGGGYYPEVKPLAAYFPEAKQLQQAFAPDPHLQPIFSPQTNHAKVVPAPARFPRRASPQPQRVIVRYHRPAYVIRKIQQVGPGADALIIRQPTPRLKEVHIHHHHDPGPVIHVHKNDDDDLLTDAEFEAAVAGQKAESEAELEAAGHFAEPAKKKKGKKASSI